MCKLLIENVNRDFYSKSDTMRNQSDAFSPKAILWEIKVTLSTQFPTKAKKPVPNHEDSGRVFI